MKNGNLLHSVQGPVLVGGREQGGGISSLKNNSITAISLHFRIYLDSIDRDRRLDNSVPGHSCAEVAGED